MRLDVKRNILLNPGPLTTTDTVKAAMVVPDICPREKSFGELVESLQRDLVRVVRGESRYETVLFGSSGTGALEAVISSVVPNGKKILIVQNGAYGERMTAIARTYYPADDVIVYSIPHGAFPDTAQIGSILESRRDIAYVAVVHHETTTGMLNPARAILSAAHRSGAGVILDAMSSFGAIPIDTRRDDYDFIVSCANKCLQGMPGVSFILCRRDKLAHDGAPSRSFYFDLWSEYDYFRRYRQTRFTPPVQVLYALKKALEEYFEEGPENRYRRYVESWETLVNGLRDMNLRLLLPLEHQSKLLTSVYEPEHRNFSFESLHDYLFERGITIYPGKTGALKTFRIANIGAIDKEDIRYFLQELKAYLVARGIIS